MNRVIYSTSSSRPVSPTQVFLSASERQRCVKTRLAVYDVRERGYTASMSSSMVSAPFSIQFSFNTRIRHHPVYF